MTPGTTTPVDWNDDPKPRVKKPKPGSKPKPKRDDGAQPEAREARPGLSGLAKRKPPKGKAKPEAEGKGRGPKPPVGKPNSKKNRARQAAKAAAAAAAKPRKPRSKT